MAHANQPSVSRLVQKISACLQDDIYDNNPYKHIMKDADRNALNEEARTVLSWLEQSTIQSWYDGLTITQREWFVASVQCLASQVEQVRHSDGCFIALTFAVRGKFPLSLSPNALVLNTLNQVSLSLHVEAHKSRHHCGVDGMFGLNFPGCLDQGTASQECSHECIIIISTTSFNSGQAPVRQWLRLYPGQPQLCT